MHITTGDIDTALSVMREAAGRLRDSGQAMWDLQELNREQLHNPPEEFYVLYEKKIAVACMILTATDRFFWPDIPPGSSLFLHKLAVRNAYTGQGYAQALIAHAAQVCRAQNIPWLRLDCDPHRTGLCRLYERAGFTLRNTETLRTRRLGLIDVAFYEMKV